ncbi:XylR N-terminal domain-containing protein [Ferviditalea candida]|uniref:XylR N-terminal domain-containing protein n=1 Tax=Ferviditalea candida TaxID=3108399 RepID=A0ABU5ZDB4_9BACL|nr:XylR N-terminal domain-containing protein [Paenibacillaceae bacterium T2]
MFQKDIKDLDIREIMDYDGNKGEIFINQSRVVLNDTHSLGRLKRDLINVLGFERAKGIMFRYGWYRGEHDARTIVEKYRYKSHDEWLTAGPKIHQTQGFGRVELTKLEFDEHKGTYYGEGFWYASYEAEEYLKHFGKSHRPVCSMMAGYGSGYVSAKFPEKVIFKEQKCRAMGDPYCTWIGKTVQEWGSEIDHESTFFEEINLLSPLDEAYQRIEKQQDAIHLSLQVHRSLMQNVIRGKKLESIASNLNDLLDVPVVIESQDFSIISTAGIPDSDAAQYSQSLFRMNEDQKKSPSFNYILKKLKEENEPVYLYIPDSYGLGHQRIIAPIFLKNELYGFISVVSNNQSQFESYRLCLEGASWVCSLSLLQEKTMVETEQRMLGNFLDEMLSDSIDKEKLMKQGRYLGYNLNVSGYVFLLEKEQDSGELFIYREKMIQQLRNYFYAQGEKCFVTEKSGYLFLLLSEKYMQNNRLTIQEMGRKLLKLLQNSDSHFVWNIGISRKYEDVTEVYRAFREAKQVIDIQKKQPKKEFMITYEELGVFRILLQHENPEELRQLAEEKLGALLQYDREYASELTKTLYYYLYNDCNMYKTAKELNLSPSGFRYRMKRIAELYDGNLHSAEEHYQLYFFLKYFIMTDELDIR